MNGTEISYALAKQLTSATTIESNYGSIDLDAELRRAVDAAVRPILERRMAAFERGSTNPENLIEGIQRQCAGYAKMCCRNMTRSLPALSPRD